MSDRFVATGKVTNNTSVPMTLASSQTSYGRFAIPPLQSIPPKATVQAFQAQGTPFTATGTQGSVVYTMGTTGARVTLSFDDPYLGSNSTAGTQSDKPQFFVQSFVPPRGSNVQFEYTVVPA